jgi:UDP-3-O-[3-hydroxymyristoyl] glucosamine N-acyltransferase
VARVREIAGWLGTAFEGDGETEIGGAATLDAAEAGELAFVAGAKHAGAAAASAAGCLIVPLDFPNPSGRAVIRVADPRTAFALALTRLYPPPRPEPGIHPSAVVHPTAELGEGVSVAAGVVIGAGTRIGAGSAIGAGCAIGRRAAIGPSAVLHPRVNIYDGVEIGARVILHSGVVLGADGFGFVMVGDHYEKFPQVGRLIIGDNVEIGANSCVDRATLGVTRIGDGTKLDNMVHIAHNCNVGRHVVIAAQTGFAGGVVIEDYAVIGGQVGIGDKARVESRAILGSGCGVLTSKIVRAGEPVWGTPARPLRQYLETLANMSRLPALRRQVSELAKRVAKLEQSGEPQP